MAATVSSGKADPTGQVPAEPNNIAGHACMLCLLKERLYLVQGRLVQTKSKHHSGHEIVFTRHFRSRKGHVRSSTTVNDKISCVSSCVSFKYFITSMLLAHRPLLPASGSDLNDIHTRIYSLLSDAIDVDG